MKQILARFFRKVNSNVVTTRIFWLRGVIKISILAAYRLGRLLPAQKSEEIMINDYDKTLKFFLDPTRRMGSAIYWQGFHEYKELTFLHSFLKPDMVVLDVGANQGEYTVFMAKRTPSGRVIAFEPLPSIGSRLKRNVEINQFRNVTVCGYGLSDREATLDLFDQAGENEGLATLFPSETANLIAASIPVKSLDQQADILGIHRLDFIKMDIDGGEWAALRGAVNVIIRFRPIVMVEINEMSCRAAGYSASEIFRFFEEIKYAPYRLDKHVNLVASPKVPDFENIFFRPQ